MKKHQLFSVLLLLFSFSGVLMAAPNDDPDGEVLFTQNCAECHQSNGKGIANIYPALAGSEVVKGSPVDVALVLIIGRGEMPSFVGAISDEDMATIINYVSNAWGNEGALITAQAIESLK